MLLSIFFIYFILFYFILDIYFFLIVLIDREVISAIHLSNFEDKDYFHSIFRIRFQTTPVISLNTIKNKWQLA